MPYYANFTTLGPGLLGSGPAILFQQFSQTLQPLVEKPLCLFGRRIVSSYIVITL